MPKQCDHQCVGALIRSEQGILMFHRNTPPAGVAGPAGHCDGDAPEYAVRKEVWEEVGLHIESANLIVEFDEQHPCRREYTGEPGHHWNFYACTVSGELNPSERETRDVRWYTWGEIQSLMHINLEYNDGAYSKLEWQQNPGLDWPWYVLFRWHVLP